MYYLCIVFQKILIILLNNKKYAIMWNVKEINFICRVVTDENGKFKFDLMLKSDVLITDGKTYESFEKACNSLKEYLILIYNYEKNIQNIDKQQHLIINETI